MRGGHWTLDSMDTDFYLDNWWLWLLGLGLLLLLVIFIFHTILRFTVLQTVPVLITATGSPGFWTGSS